MWPAVVPHPWARNRGACTWAKARYLGDVDTAVHHFLPGDDEAQHRAALGLAPAVPPRSDQTAALDTHTRQNAAGRPPLLFFSCRGYASHAQRRRRALWRKDGLVHHWWLPHTADQRGRRTRRNPPARRRGQRRGSTRPPTGSPRPQSAPPARSPATRRGLARRGQHVSRTRSGHGRRRRHHTHYEPQQNRFIK